MCRLMGISYGENREALDTGEIAAILFPALVRQGPHAYGWMTYNETTEQIDHAKFPGRCDTEEAWRNIIENVDPAAKWFVGHTRWATHGSPEDIRNNHPIPHGNVIGVHNGVITNYRNILAATGREDPKTIVDSEAIFAAVNRWGPTKGLGRVKGDMVAIYSDRRKPHLIHLARSQGRQITLGWTERGNLIFASDKEALLKLQPEIQFEHFSTVSENRLLVIRNGKIISRYDFGKKPKYVAPPAVVHVKAGASRERASSALPGFSRDYFQSIAERRGSILFPEGPPEQKHAKRRTVNQNQKLYYKDGIFMTHSEYIEAMAEEGKDV